MISDGKLKEIIDCNILTVDLPDHLATHTKISFINCDGSSCNLPIKLKVHADGSDIARENLEGFKVLTTTSTCAQFFYLQRPTSIYSSRNFGTCFSTEPVDVKRTNLQKGCKKGHVKITVLRKCRRMAVG